MKIRVWCSIELETNCHIFSTKHGKKIKVWSLLWKICGFFGLSIIKLLFFYTLINNSLKQFLKSFQIKVGNLAFLARRGGPAPPSLKSVSTRTFEDSAPEYHFFEPHWPSSNTIQVPNPTFTYWLPVFSTSLNFRHLSY